MPVVRTVVRRAFARAAGERPHWSINPGVHEAHHPAHNQAHHQHASASQTLPISATLITTDTTVEHVVLSGHDGDRFNKIKECVGDIDITAVAISDQDGPAAVGWTIADGAQRGLPLNEVASALADLAVFGPMVVTGPGQGSEDCMTSIHAGLRRAIEAIAREVRADSKQ
jgi:hypothetical protein